MNCWRDKYRREEVRRKWRDDATVSQVIIGIIIFGFWAFFIWKFGDWIIKLFNEFFV